MEEKIKKALEKIKPALAADNGGVEFVSWDEGTKTVEVRLLGMCAGCPMAQITLQNAIAAEIKKEVPEVKKVTAV